MLIFDLSHIRPGAALIIGKPVRRKRKAPEAVSTERSEAPVTPLGGKKRAARAQRGG